MLGRIMETNDDWVVPRTGIKERRFVEPGIGSAELGATASEAALADAGLKAGDIDLVIFATMTPDHYFPGNGGLLARRLGMKTTHALDIRMQCTGFLRDCRPPTRSFARACTTASFSWAPRCTAAPCRGPKASGT